MAPKSRGIEGLFNAFGNTSRPHICRSCERTLFRRNYASTATSAASAPAIEQPQIQTSTQVDISQPNEVALPTVPVEAGIVLSRPPLITPDPHPFETAYHLYQRRLNERLVLPFTQYFYYKRGTPAFEQWRARRKERGGVAGRDVGEYNAHSDEGWNDEALVGYNAANPQKIVEKLVAEEGRAADFTGNGDPKTAGLRRTTEADQNNDQRSLERSLSRTLYLLVKQKGKDGDREKWLFPSGPLESKEGLKEAAQRVLGQFCGVNMNTWFVGNHPVGHYVSAVPRPDDTTSKRDQQSETEKDQATLASTADSESGYRTFYMKARILAGQADVQSATKKYDDFKWLSKDEVEKHVSNRYWSRIKNMLVEQ